jgi:hypothetical protein
MVTEPDAAAPEPVPWKPMMSLSGPISLPVEFETA